MLFGRSKESTAWFLPITMLLMKVFQSLDFALRASTSNRSTSEIIAKPARMVAALMRARRVVTLLKTTL